MGGIGAECGKKQGGEEEGNPSTTGKSLKLEVKQEWQVKGTRVNFEAFERMCRPEQEHGRNQAKLGVVPIVGRM